VIIEHFSLCVINEALRTNIDWKSPFLKGAGHFIPKFQVEEDIVPSNHLYTVSKIGQWMPYNVASESFHTKTVCSTLSQRETRFIRKRSLCVSPPPPGRLRGNDDVYLRLVVKRVIDFLLVIIELFRYVLLVRCYERISIESRLLWNRWANLAQNFR